MSTTCIYAATGDLVCSEDFFAGDCRAYGCPVGSPCASATECANGLSCPRGTCIRQDPFSRPHFWHVPPMPPRPVVPAPSPVPTPIQVKVDQIRQVVADVTGHCLSDADCQPSHRCDRYTCQPIVVPAPTAVVTNVNDLVFINGLVIGSGNKTTGATTSYWVVVRLTSNVYIASLLGQFAACGTTASTTASTKTCVSARGSNYVDVYVFTPREVKPYTLSNITIAFDRATSNFFVSSYSGPS